MQLKKSYKRRHNKSIIEVLSKLAYLKVISPYANFINVDNIAKTDKLYLENKLEYMRLGGIINDRRI